MQLNKQIALLTIRLLLGIIFFFQGFGKVFKIGLDNVYQNFFVTNYSEQLPDFVLLFSAYYTSIVELLAGFLLVIGYQRNYALYALASVLIIVTFGHGLKEPIWDLSHIMFRAILLISLLLLPQKLDIFAIDFLINKKQNKK